MRIQAIGIYSMFNILLGGDLASTTLVKKEPVPVVEEYVMEQPEPSLPEPEPVKVNSFQATFTNYVSWCNGCSGITASGYDVRNTVYYGEYRILAGDKSIPFGTKYLVELEDGTTFKAIVLDRGGVIKGTLYDLLVSSVEEAIKFGRQKVTLTEIEEG